MGQSVSSCGRMAATVLLVGLVLALAACRSTSVVDTSTLENPAGGGAPPSARDHAELTQLAAQTDSEVAAVFLTSARPAVWRSAATELARRGGEIASRALLTGLFEPAIGEEAQDALAAMRPPPVSEVTELLRLDLPDIVRLRAVRALFGMGALAAPAMVALNAQLRSGNPLVRAESILALARLHPVPAETRAAVGEMMAEQDARVRGAAAVALIAWGDRVATTELVPLAMSTLNQLCVADGVTAGDDLRWVVTAIGAVPLHGAMIEDYLLEVAGHRDGGARFRAIEAFARVARDAGPRLLGLLCDSAHAAAAVEVAEVLWVEFPDARPTAESKLVEALRDPGLRSRAAFALRWTLRGGAVPALCAALQDPDPTQRAEAVRALYNIGGPFDLPDRQEVAPRFRPEDIAELRNIMDGRDALVSRIHAAGVLLGYRLDTKHPVRFLLAALEDESWGIRKSAAEALAVGGSASRLALPSLDRLAEADDNAGVRYAASAAAGRIANRRGLGYPGD